ncbi:MAG: hypothetical protein ACE5HF_02955 [Gemmatimonadota bacterium]
MSGRFEPAIAVAACLGAAGCLGRGTPSNVALSCGTPRKAADLPAVLVEASGIVRDPRSPDLFWLHNDSGNELAVYGVDAGGALRATVHLRGATNVDAEDIALGHCAYGPCLYVADIGDNLAVRPEVFLYRVPLPPLPAGLAPDGSVEGHGAAGAVEDTVDVERIIRLRYAGGPRDAESLVSDPAGEDLLIVTKGRDGVVALYRIPFPELESEDVIIPARVGRLPVPSGSNSSQFVTAADLSPDGRTFAVRSYTTLFLFAWSSAASFDTTAVPRTASLLPALEAQGEGLTFSDDGRSILLASEGAEGRGPQLSRLTCGAAGR